jgi:hypothetical protein
MSLLFNIGNFVGVKNIIGHIIRVKIYLMKVSPHFHGHFATGGDW